MNNKSHKRIVVGMSGGVDSSMAALLLKRQGWQPVGVSFKMKDGDGFKTANKVCQKLNQTSRHRSQVRI